jgi:hypothetical protein
MLVLVDLKRLVASWLAVAIYSLVCEAVRNLKEDAKPFREY